MPAKKATETKPERVLIKATNPALEIVSVTIPQERGNKVPYTTTIMVPGFGAKHFVIPRGKPVNVPMYVAQAIMEDVMQQDKTEILMQSLADKYEAATRAL